MTRSAARFLLFGCAVSIACDFSPASRRGGMARQRATNRIEAEAIAFD